MSSEDYPAMPEKEGRRELIDAREAQRRAGLNLHLKPSDNLGKHH